VAATIPVGPHPSAVAVGQGSVWVAVRGERHEDNAVVRIDPDTGEVVARIPGDVVPGWEVGGGGIAVDDGSIWVAGSTGEGAGLIERIDTASNRVVDAIPVKGSPADVATFASGYVWVLLRSDRGTPRLLQIEVSPDPTQGSSHDVVSETDLPGAYGRRLVNAGGQMFAVVATPPGGPVDDSLLYRLDPWTGRVEGALDLHSYAPVAGSPTQLWAATGDALVRVDPETGRALGDPVAVSNTGDAVAIGEGGVWFFDPVRDRAVSRFNPVTGRVDVSVDGTAGIDLAVYQGSVWVVNAEDSITRIDLS
jgi:streptogramin lyase